MSQKTAEEKLAEARARLNALRGSHPRTVLLYLDDSGLHFSIRTIGGLPKGYEPGSDDDAAKGP